MKIQGDLWVSFYYFSICIYVNNYGIYIKIYYRKTRSDSGGIKENGWGRDD